MRIGAIGEVRSDINKKKKSTANEKTSNNNFSKVLNNIEYDDSLDEESESEKKSSRDSDRDLLNLLR